MAMCYHPASPQIGQSCDQELKVDDALSASPVVILLQTEEPISRAGRGFDEADKVSIHLTQNTVKD